MAEPVLSTEQTQRSLWIGDLPHWLEEPFLFNLFVGTTQLVSVKLIRNRATGGSEGYAFLEFRTHEAADSILKTYNGHAIPGTDVIFRLNWAAYGVGKAQPSGEDHSLFVGDLAPDVSDMILQEYFRQFYPSVRSAKVITDAATGRSKGYGFVRFGMENERDRALAEMNGHFLSNRPIRVSLATARKNQVGAAAMQAPHPSDFDPTNTTLFIGGLSSAVSEEQLRAVFSRFGDIIYVKIPQGKGCGFVQFVLRTSAERAMGTMNGQILGNSAIRITWGRSSSRAANQAAQLASLAGLPGAGAFPNSGFGDPALLAAAGGFPQPFAAGALLQGGDPYGSFGQQGQPDIFNGYHHAAAGFMPMPGNTYAPPSAGLPHSLATFAAANGMMHAPQPPPGPSSTDSGGPALATAGSNGLADVLPPADGSVGGSAAGLVSHGSGGSSGGGGDGSGAASATGESVPLPSRASGDSTDAVDAIADGLAAVAIEPKPGSPQRMAPGASPAAPVANGKAQHPLLVGSHLLTSLLG